jgi:hypothetical protein
VEDAAEPGSAAPVVPADGPQELATLRQQADSLATALEEIRQRIERLGKPGSEPVAEQGAGECR